MNTLARIGFSFLALFVFVGSALAQQIPTLDFFHGRECPHCQNEKKWFPELKKAYPDIVINEYEVWHDAANQALMNERLDALGAESNGVPTNIIGNEVVTGFVPDAILAILEKNYGPPALGLQSSVEPETREAADFTWLLIVLGGLVLAGAVAFAGKKS